MHTHTHKRNFQNDVHWLRAPSMVGVGWRKYGKIVIHIHINMSIIRLAYSF